MQNSLRHKKGSGDGYNAPLTLTLTDALQSEVTRLMEENLTLREMMEKGGGLARSPQGRIMIGCNSECLCACVGQGTCASGDVVQVSLTVNCIKYIEQVTRFLMMQSMIINFVGHTFHFFAHYFLPPNPTPVPQARCPIPAPGLLQNAST